LNTPKTVFKIVPAGEWADAVQCGEFTGSADDQRDGFIHLSTAAQVAGTLHRHFRNRSDLLLVALDAAALGPDLRYDVSRDGDLFPHLYAPLPAAAALAQHRLPLGADGIPEVQPDWLTC
jgi:uncharacterized protein (DUF952 family)